MPIKHSSGKRKKRRRKSTSSSPSTENIEKKSNSSSPSTENMEEKSNSSSPSEWTTVRIKLDILRCALCNRHLIPPIYQFEKGFIVTCPKCRRCSSSTPGFIRNYALEQVIESLSIRCSHSIHESYGALVQHLTTEHNFTIYNFSYDIPLRVSMSLAEPLLVLNASNDDDGDIFVLLNMFDKFDSDTNPSLDYYVPSTFARSICNEALLGKDPHLARRTDKKGHMAVTGTNCEVVKALVDADLAIVMLPDRDSKSSTAPPSKKLNWELTSNSDQLMSMDKASTHATDLTESPETRAPSEFHSQGKRLVLRQSSPPNLSTPGGSQVQIHEVKVKEKHYRESGGQISLMDDLAEVVEAGAAKNKMILLDPSKSLLQHLP
ncbi:hypothetical protein ZIOFF_008974 [Zingiber officinale]|uniref:Uncharacterized protein n=1 Tax=Zingiber officinale TaxID=94328 RepID=A0A8J5HTC2_ZINOF|nr:hypothetical protein ZIOFF_008974 [Zingiber officinale]